MDAKVGVEGLAEFGRALRQLDPEAAKGIRLAGNAAATLLVDRTRPGMPSVSGRARASLKARSTRTSARVGIGGKRAPYVPWLDFGGEGRIKGHPAHRPFIKEGRYLYPTLAKISPEIETVLVSALTDIARGAGLDVD